MELFFTIEGFSGVIFCSSTISLCKSYKIWANNRLKYFCSFFIIQPSYYLKRYALWRVCHSGGLVPPLRYPPGRFRHLGGTLEDHGRSRKEMGVQNLNFGQNTGKNLGFCFGLSLVLNFLGVFMGVNYSQMVN